MEFKKTYSKEKTIYFLKNVLIRSPLIKNKKAIYEYIKAYNYIPKELENYFDGEISILIVDKNYRERHIGEKMILNIFNKVRNDNMKNLEILSDDSCNFKFYERMNCKKIYEKTITNGEPDNYGNMTSKKAYIYEKILYK